MRELAAPGAPAAAGARSPKRGLARSAPRSAGPPRSLWSLHEERLTLPSVHPTVRWPRPTWPAPPFHGPPHTHARPRGGPRLGVPPLQRAVHHPRPTWRSRGEVEKTSPAIAPDTSLDEVVGKGSGRQALTPPAAASPALEAPWSGDRGEKLPGVRAAPLSGSPAVRRRCPRGSVTWHLPRAHAGRGLDPSSPGAPRGKLSEEIQPSCDIKQPQTSFTWESEGRTSYLRTDRQSGKPLKHEL